MVITRTLAAQEVDQVQKEVKAAVKPRVGEIIILPAALMLHRGMGVIGPRNQEEQHSVALWKMERLCHLCPRKYQRMIKWVQEIRGARKAAWY